MKTLSRVAIALSLALLAAGPLMAQTGHDLFQQALVKERADGDLRGAIAIYERIVREFTADRTLAAKALVQLGQCYETLGSTEAERAYRRVVQDFADQSELVARAQARLAVLQRTERERTNLGHQPTFTRIEIASRPQNGVLSPDGSRLAFVSDGGVWVVPVHGNVDPNVAGQPVRLADIEGVWDNTSQLTWSENGRWIAVNGESDDHDAVYVVPADGGEPRVIRMPKRGSHPYSYRLSLSPDGGTLAFSALAPNQEAGPNETQTRFIFSVPVAGGAPRQLTSMTGRLPAFSPDGRWIAYVSHRQHEEGSWESDLWVVPAAGGQPVKVIGCDRGRIRGPVWSPQGDFIAAHLEPGLNNFSNELWVVPVDSTGRGSSPIKIHLPNASWNMSAGWTPDNRLGVFMSTPEQHGVAYTVPATGGKAVQVTSERGQVSYLAWSPDGNRIFLQWRLNGGGANQVASPASIASIPVAGGEVTGIPVAWGRDSLEAGVGLDLSPDGKKIVFMGGTRMAGRRPQGEDLGIWTVSVDGTGLHQLTSGPTYDAFPRWSRDGKWIAFLRLQEEPNNDMANIQLIPSAGGELKQITSDTDSVAVANIAFSPDGKKIAYFSSGAIWKSRGTIKVVSVENGRSETLVTVGEPSPFPELAWSPDGTRIAHTAGEQIFVDDLSSGRRTKLATGLAQGFQYGSVAWSPDGERMAFVVWRPSEKEFWLISDFLPQR